MKHIHFNEADIIASSQRHVEARKADLSDPGRIGVAPRIANEVQPAFSLAVVREVNRGSDAEHIFEAVARVMASQALSLVHSCTEGDLASRVAVMNDLMLLLGQAISHAFEHPDDVSVQSTRAVPGGRA